MPDLPPPPPPKGAVPETDSVATSNGVARSPRRWIIWLGAAAVIATVVIALAASQRGEQPVEAGEEHPVGEHLTVADPTPSTPVLDGPQTFRWKMPRVVGLPVNQAKAALRARIGNAQPEDQSVSLRDAYDLRLVFRITKRETGSAEPGTVLQVGNRPALPTSATLTIPTDIQPGDRVRTVVRLVVAKAATGATEPTCTTGYSPCLIYHGGADYDCYGGEGLGPYFTEPGVTYDVRGADPYDLDREGDGSGCE
jgi:hypothetical protein